MAKTKICDNCGEVIDNVRYNTRTKLKNLPVYY